MTPAVPDNWRETPFRTSQEFRRGEVQASGQVAARFVSGRNSGGMAEARAVHEFSSLEPKRQAVLDGFPVGLRGMPMLNLLCHPSMDENQSISWVFDEVLAKWGGLGSLCANYDMERADGWLLEMRNMPVLILGTPHLFDRLNREAGTHHMASGSVLLHIGPTFVSGFEELTDTRQAVILRSMRRLGIAHQRQAFGMTELGTPVYDGGDGQFWFPDWMCVRALRPDGRECEPHQLGQLDFYDALNPEAPHLLSDDIGAVSGGTFTFFGRVER